MKICFPVDENKGLESKIHGRFGTARMFLLVDSETGTIEELQGRSPQVGPQFDFDGTDVEAIVIGNIGSRTLFELNRSGLKVYQAQKSTLADNLELAKKSELTELTTSSFRDEADTGFGAGRGVGMGAGFGSGRGARCVGRGKGRSGGRGAGRGNGRGAGFSVGPGERF